MIDEILINVSPAETRAALVENGILQELFIERTADQSHVGNIYCGKIIRVLPGMQAAFIDIGLERTAFLHINDVNLSAMDKPENTDISSVFREGQLLSVQIMKDPLGTKGARLTTYYSLSSHYLVFMPQNDNIGVSQRIEDEAARIRLHDAVETLASEHHLSGGFIVRTAAECCSEEELIADMKLLNKQWQRALSKQKGGRSGDLLHQDLPMVQRVLRDAVQGGVQRVLVDDEEASKQLHLFTEEYVPEAAASVSYYQGKRPIFDIYAIEEEIAKALRRRVDLRSGGYVIFDQTEAMTTVDVNTGGFVGRTNLEETAYKTNLEAATAIARQLRVRNLGGMIIIDFIDMKDEEHCKQLNRVLETALSQDRAKTSRYELKELGLAALTRKRTRESLEHVLCDICPSCDGQGSIRSITTVVNGLFRDINREAKAYDKKQLVVVVANDVGEVLLEEESERLSDFETELGVSVRVRIEPEYARDQFDVILL